MIMFYVYILFSESLQKYYVGFTSNIENRLEHHNSRQNKWSKKGVPWEMVHFIAIEGRANAMNLERKIKNMGAKRFLENHPPSIK
jgi:putative endonuclease